MVISEGEFYGREVRVITTIDMKQKDEMSKESFKEYGLTQHEEKVRLFHI